MKRSEQLIEQQTLDALEGRTVIQDAVVWFDTFGNVFVGRELNEFIIGYIPSSMIDYEKNKRKLFRTDVVSSRNQLVDKLTMFEVYKDTMRFIKNDEFQTVLS